MCHKICNKYENCNIPMIVLNSSLLKILIDNTRSLLYYSVRVKVEFSILPIYQFIEFSFTPHKPSVSPASVTGGT